MSNRARTTSLATFAILALTPLALAGECEGDLDGNGTVDFSDVIAVLQDYGCASECSGDANADGAVDFQDLILVLQNFGCGSAACESNADCDDGDDCTIDFCTPFGCMHFPIAGCG